MSETKTQTLEELIASKFEAETFSPYGLAKIVNEILSILGSSKILPPQMFYTYAKKGMIKADSSKYIAKIDAIEWTSKYIAKNIQL